MFSEIDTPALSQTVRSAAIERDTQREIESAWDRLQLQPPVTDRAVRGAWRRLRALYRAEDLPAHLQVAAAELSKRLDEAYQLLAREELRARYEAERSGSWAAQDGDSVDEADPIPPFRAGALLGLPEAIDLLRRGRAAQALERLEELRVTHPSEPAVMAGLAWAHHLGEAAESEVEALTWADLALRFDPRNRPALELLARLALAALPSPLPAEPDDDLLVRLRTTRTRLERAQAAGAAWTQAGIERIGRALEAPRQKPRKRRWLRLPRRDKKNSS